MGRDENSQLLQHSQRKYLRLQLPIWLDLSLEFARGQREKHETEQAIELETPTIDTELKDQSIQLEVNAADRRSGVSCPAKGQEKLYLGGCQEEHVTKTE